MSLRARLAEGDAIVALGAVDGLTARIAERAGVEALYHGGYALAAHQFGVPDVGLVGRAEVVESVRRMRAATSLPDRGRRRHGVRERVRRLAHGAGARGGGRERDPDRGPGRAEALRAHGGQGGDPTRRDGAEGPCGRRRPALRRDGDRRADGRAPGDGARRRHRQMQRVRRGRRRPPVRRRSTDAEEYERSRRAARRRASRT